MWSITDAHFCLGFKALLGSFRSEYFLSVLCNLGSYRLFNPRSYGTIFSDTLINPTDTLLDGAPDPSAEYASISVFETGAYAQLTNSLFKLAPNSQFLHVIRKKQKLHQDTIRIKSRTC